MTSQEEESRRILKPLVIFLGILGILATISLTVCLILKKYRKALSTLNKDTDLVPLTRKTCFPSAPMKNPKDAP